MSRRKPQPRCILIARPNGAGKTTFAREYLPKIAGVIQFVNADLIAQGLSPLDPQLAALACGREGTMCRVPMCSGVLHGAGRIFCTYTVLWRMNGRYTTIQANRRN
jgi:predicted ABC-type ATPase